MKLAPDAAAALTLGPQMGLNKLMQAAKGQRVTLVATAEVSRLVREQCSLKAGTQLHARHVIQWVLHNTAEHNQRVRALACTSQRRINCNIDDLVRSTDSVCSVCKVNFCRQLLARACPACFQDAANT